ncbi:uncharacterized protein CTRU02_209119 [Colletotrichum truncatum]|uniref:Uncharacterized protein n=1 Tax=Colletotrichum truncatum TaxID=5467 RepID=A0ACC3YY60_COLTU|nr:uncharacterized protein CTRU02_07690 [Colletotrichum truncatum]KAF6790784.1 hypothetical protein CTRU02_07690 [Colletotrichum truncatum]
MSVEYHRPTVSDDLSGSFDDTPALAQGWLASHPDDGLSRSMDAAHAPVTSTASSHGTSDNPGKRHMLVDDNSSPGNARSRPRSATVRRTSSLPVTESQNPKSEIVMSADEGQIAADPESSSDETVVEETPKEDEESSQRPASPSNGSTLTNFTAITGKTHGSSSSSGSGSTITQSSWPRHRGSEKSRQFDKSHIKPRRRSRSPRIQQQQQQQQHHNAFQYLEPDSPNVTAEATQHAIEQSYWRMPQTPSYQSPSAMSNASTASSSFQSDVFSELDHETDRSSSPDHSTYGGSPNSMPGSMPGGFDAHLAAAAQQRQREYRSYGTPEMPRGNANLPHIPPNALQPRLPGTHHGHPKHLPRAEKLPLTGYELIASKLCAGDSDRTSIRPIYRRFEALNHRLLLHLQDELAELEEQLHRLDTADTQTRRLQNCFLPASRRQEALTAGELQWHKTDVLGKIGYKLGQYNHVLSSFKETQCLPGPDSRDIEYYRAYLANHNPIVEIETRFLDPTDDLVSLARPSSSYSRDTDFSSDELRTPMPRKSAFRFTGPKAERIRKIQAFLLNSYPLAVAVAFAAAFLLPILTFAVIPGFVGRMAVVLLVAVGVALAVVQAGIFGTGKNRTASQAATEGLMVSGIYVGVMAVVAGIFG